MVQERLGVVGIASPDVAGRAHHIDSENRYDVAFRSRGAAARHRWSRTFLPARRDVITTSRSCAIRQPSMFQCDRFWGRWANERSRTAPVSHQKRPRQNATNTLELHQNSKKFNEVSCILPLITVWLQVRVLPGPPSGYSGFDLSRLFFRFVSLIVLGPRTETLFWFRYSSRRVNAFATIVRWRAWRM